MNSKLREILNDFRQQSIVIDNNNSLGGGERGAEAFKSSLAEAEKAIRQAVAEEMLGLVGADEDLFGDAYGYHEAQNELKAELRQKIKQWQGSEDE